MSSVMPPKMLIMPPVVKRQDDSEVKEEQRGTKRKISLINCAVCGSDEAKYKCPACLTHSCSVSCVKRHKDDSGCSGVRNKTAFVSLPHFDEMALLNDYRFLEDAGRFADGATRDKLAVVPRSTLRTRKLISSAHKMNISLRLLPITFTKSRENSTIFDRKGQQFLWHLKLVFPQSRSEFAQKRVNDQKTLQQILTDYIHPTESDPVTRQKLKIYVHFPFDHVKVFMKAEREKANSVRYHQLELKKSLRENLSYKLLVEYPVLHVVLKDQWENFPLKEPAAPAPTCRGPVTKNMVVGQRREAVVPKTQETTPESEPLQGARKSKAGRGDEDREEGEVSESEDEEEEHVSRDESRGGASLARGETAGRDVGGDQRMSQGVVVSAEDA